jgi:hypothetical protein
LSPDLHAVLFLLSIPFNARSLICW